MSYYFVSGGLPIVVDNQLIGAVGVGGGNADEQCAYQALVKVLGPQPPIAQPIPPAGGAGGPGGAGGGGGAAEAGGRPRSSWRLQGAREAGRSPDSEVR